MPAIRPRPPSRARCLAREGPAEALRSALADLLRCRDYISRRLSQDIECLPAAMSARRRLAEMAPTVSPGMLKRDLAAARVMIGEAIDLHMRLLRAGSDGSPLFAFISALDSRPARRGGHFARSLASLYC